jgi:hypothetical protein
VLAPKAQATAPYGNGFKESVAVLQTSVGDGHAIRLDPIDQCSHEGGAAVLASERDRSDPACA